MTETLVDLIETAGGTARSLGPALGLSPSTVQAWLSHRRPIPPKHLDAIAAALELDAITLHHLAARERGLRV